MAFKFSLQALLRLRLSYERQERLRLEISLRRLRQHQQQMEELEHAVREANGRLATALQEGMSAIELHFEVAQAHARAERQKHLTEQLVKLTEEHRAQQAAYQRARQQRQILENLRQRLLDAYRLVQARRDQQQLDDLFLIRRNVAPPH